MPNHPYNVGYDRDPNLPAALIAAVRNVLNMHVGRSQAIPRPELLRQVRLRCATDDRKLRQVINHLRKTGVLILSTGGESGGYWLAADADEAEEFIQAEFISRARDLQEQAKAMRQAIEDQWPQKIQPNLF